MMEPIQIDKIHLRADARPIDRDTIAALAESIAAVGLINPIRVRQDGERFEVIAGAHRFEACKSLGLAEVECDVVPDDDLHAELAMIDENLCRAELSPSDRARQTARRKAIYEELHPETRHGGDRKSDQVANSATRSFAAETAAVTGSSARSVRQDAERGQKVLPEVLDMIRGSKLDTGTYLDKLKSMPGSEQFHAVKRDLAVLKSGGKAARKAGQAQHDLAREEARAGLPDEVKAQQAAKDAAILARKARSADSDDDIDALRAELDEMREANAALEAGLAKLKSENAKWQDMRVQFEQGGFEKVIADKDEEIRVLNTRLIAESRDKASWAKSAKFWKAEAMKLGYGDEDVIPLDDDIIIPLGEKADG